MSPEAVGHFKVAPSIRFTLHVANLVHLASRTNQNYTDNRDGGGG